MAKKRYEMLSVQEIYYLNDLAHVIKRSTVMADEVSKAVEELADDTLPIQDLPTSIDLQECANGAIKSLADANMHITSIAYIAAEKIADMTKDALKKNGDWEQKYSTSGDF